ncbi:MAG: LPS-assembly protein LptD [Gemmobacter sp.]
MRHLLALLASVIAAVALWAARAPEALAQEGPATLVADRVEVLADDRLVAEGSVEVYHGVRRLTAPRIVYDRALGRIFIEGPAVLTEGDAMTLVASEADLDDRLRSGILRGAELTLSRALRIRADEAERARLDGLTRTRLSRAAASSCRVCDDGPPLWEIRARTVDHDTLSRRLYFRDAQLRVAGVPILWMPYLSVPDPTLKRAPGLLRPRFLITTAGGAGLEFGYFQPLGRSRDLTLYPFVGDTGAQRLRLRYREAFAWGMLNIDGALARKDATSGVQGYAELTTGAPLPRGFKLDLAARATGQGAILRDWGISDAERLEVESTLSRTNRLGTTSARVLSWRSTRTGPSGIERDRGLVLGTGSELRRWLRLPGDAGRIDAALQANFDRSDAQSSGTTSLARAGLALGWRADRVLPLGILAAASVRVDADAYRVQPVADPTFSVSRLRPAALAELRWPFRRAGEGHVDLLEPVVQVVVAPRIDEAGVPNRDSLVPELDRGNLLSFSRYPGVDRRESGNRVQFGLGLTRRAASGASREMVLGGIVRPGADALFAPEPGAAGWSGEWLVAARLDGADGRTVSGRVVLDAQGAPARSDLGLTQSLRDLDLSTSWTWAAADPDSPDVRLRTDISNLSAQITARLGPHLRADASGYFDVAAGEPTVGRLALAYINECLRADLSFDTRFTAAEGLLESSEIAFSFELLGFGGSPAGPLRACRPPRGADGDVMAATVDRGADFMR